VPVFETIEGTARQLAPEPFDNEKELQQFFEGNLEELLGLRLVATEFVTGEKHGGRIDTLGLDEDGNPVIVEYKFDKSESVMNQGLFYLDWLLDHRGDFELAAQKRLGQVDVSWQGPRLILVASSYTKYDSYAVNQLQPNIQLLPYQRYADGTFVLDSVNEPLSSKPAKSRSPKTRGEIAVEYGLDYHRQKTNNVAWAAFLDLRDQLVALDGVEERVNQKSQISYRTTKSFAACLFKKSGVMCQFKGPTVIDDPAGRAKDIQSYQWGYQWAVDVKARDDVDYVFKLLKDAYDREQ
jgi:predicted transport protein